MKTTTTTQDPTGTLLLEGSVKKFIYSSATSDYAVAVFTVGQSSSIKAQQEITLVGAIPEDLQGKQCVVHVKPSESKKYGKQYQYLSLKKVMLPTTLSGFVNYMKQQFKLGPKTASELYNSLLLAGKVGSANPYTQLDACLERVLTRRGGGNDDDKPAVNNALLDTSMSTETLKRLVPELFLPRLLGAKKVMQLLAAWHQQKKTQKATQWFYAMGLSSQDIGDIEKRYSSAFEDENANDMLMHRIQQDPYRLCVEFGLKFELVDGLLQRQQGQKFEHDQSNRIRAALTHALQRTCLYSGHLCLPVMDLCNSVSKLLWPNVYAYHRQKQTEPMPTLATFTKTVWQVMETMATHAVHPTLIFDPFEKHVSEKELSQLGGRICMRTKPMAPIVLKNHVTRGNKVTYAYNAHMWLHELEMAQTLALLPKPEHGLRLGVALSSVDARRLLGHPYSTRDEALGAYKVQELIDAAFYYDHHFKADSSQVKALFRMIRDPISLVTGGAGTGKTTLLKSVVNLCHHSGIRCILAAPTGRAAKRMEEKTEHSAHTLHSLVARWDIHVGDKALYGVGGKRLDGGSDDMDVDIPEEDAMLGGDPSQMLVVLVDEMSMVDAIIFWKFLRCLRLVATLRKKQIKLILIGDPHQLPPPGPGAVFTSLLQSKAFTTCVLKQVHRQRQGSVLDTATRIIHVEEYVKKEGHTGDHAYTDACFGAAAQQEQPGDGKPRELFFIATRSNKPGGSNKNVDFFVAMALRMLQTYVQPGLTDTFKDIQWLSPMRRGALGVAALNQHVQSMYNPPTSTSKFQPELQKRSADVMQQWTFRMGDKVMFTHNDYELDLRNGQQGFVTHIDTAAQSVTVDFNMSSAKGDTQYINDDSGQEEQQQQDEKNNAIVTIPKASLEHLVPAYAITVHKSQGCEFDMVFIFVPGLKGERSSFVDRRLLYTALTRTKKRCVIFAERWAMEAALRNLQNRHRHTLLHALLAPSTNTSK